MTPFAIQLTKGFKIEDLDKSDLDTFKHLQNIGAIEEVDALFKLKSLYRAGELYISQNNLGFLESMFKEQKDLLIEQKDLADAKHGDSVVVKRLIAKRGRPSGKVISIIKHSIITTIYISKIVNNSIEFFDIRTMQSAEIFAKDDPKIYKEGTLFKVNALTNEVEEILGHISDPKIDEKISLSLFNRFDKFPQDVVKQATEVSLSVKESECEGRVDLRDLDFCTIDPVTAKDFDDAIYLDIKENTLYVAIADVSYYVEYFSPIDKEAIKRGFTTYLPHKSFPMLPRELSENICSLKSGVDRLAFVSKIKLNENNEPIKEEFFEAVIHSKRRFNYDQIDSFIDGNFANPTEVESRIFKWLSVLYKITRELKAKRLKVGYDFRSEEIKLTLNSSHLLKETIIETGTPSHSLIEECMLLANQASAKRFSGEGDSIFRIHDAPKEQKIVQLVANLAAIGIFVEPSEEVKDTISDIQKEAKKLDLEAEVDELIIKSLKQASYSAYNIGHFGLGFTHYSHFTSPIRRYSDLILHRLIKAQLRDDKKELEYLLRNIEPLSSRVSELEREATKCEWDFRDRKFARWASENINNTFDAEIIEIDIEDTNKGAKAKLLNGARGAIVDLKSYNSNLFDKITIKITEATIDKPTIIATEHKE
jgi:ribonuclease R